MEFENLTEEELKKRIANTEKKISSIKKKTPKKSIALSGQPKKTFDFKKFDFKNIDFGLNIDKYTQIDDILRELYKQQQLTNKLLYSLYLKSGSSNTTIINPSEGITGDSLEGLLSERYRSKVKNFVNQIITGTKVILEMEGSGAISEMLFLSSDALAANAVYGVRIISDGIIIYQDTYTGFTSRSNYETDMTAFNDAGNSNYVLTFQSIAYDNSFKIEVYDSTATFTDIYIKYHEKIGA